MKIFCKWFGHFWANRTFLVCQIAVGRKCMCCGAWEHRIVESSETGRFTITDWRSGKHPQAF